MWLVQSAFEGSQEPFTKLLKPGQRYEVGRKAPAHLILAEKTVSQSAGAISVDPWKQPSRWQPGEGGAVWPEIHLHVGKKAVRIIPADEEKEWLADPQGYVGKEAQASQRRTLQDGDRMAFTRNTEPIQVRWRPMVIWCEPGVWSAEEMASRKQQLNQVGIALIESPRVVRDVTHLVTRSSSLSVQMLEALMAGACLVTAQFVEEVTALAPTLENVFTLPDRKEYFPEQSSEMDNVTYEEFRSKVEPDDRRKDLLKGLSILFVSADEETRRTFKECQHVYESAGAYNEVCPTATLSRFESRAEVERFLEQRLEDAQDRASAQRPTQSSRPSLPSSVSEPAAVKRLVIIASPSDHQRPWYKLFAKVSKKLGIYMPEEGLDALQLSIALIAPSRYLARFASQEDDSDQEPEQPDIEDASAFQQQSEQAVATSIAEPSPSPTPVNAVLRPSPAPPVPVPPSTKTTPPRRPKRRAGIEQSNPFEDLFGSSSVAPTMPPAPSQSAIPDTQTSMLPATQASPSQPTRRRNVAGQREQPRRSDVWQSMFADTTPSLATQAGQTGQSIGSMTSTQGRYTRRFREALEQDERRAEQRLHQQTQPSTSQPDGDTTVVPRTHKRRAETDGEEQRATEADVGQRTRASPAPPPTTATMEATSAADTQMIAEQPSHTSKTPARDERFLQSMASLRKSKKPVDALDKEFDQLRIARPVHSEIVGDGIVGRTTDSILVHENEAEDPEYLAWQRMSMDDFDIGAAGNFVQVDFVPLVRRDTTRNTTPVPAAYAGRANFKKFRGKNVARRVPVTLELDEAPDGFLAGRHAAPMRSQRMLDPSLPSQAVSAMTQGPSTAMITQKRSIFTAQRNAEASGSDEEREDHGGRTRGHSATPSSQLGTQTKRIDKPSRLTALSEQDEGRRTGKVLNTQRTSQRTNKVDLRLDVDDSPDMLDDTGVFDTDSDGTASFAGSMSGDRTVTTLASNRVASQRLSAKARPPAAVTPAKRGASRSTTASFAISDDDDDDEDEEPQSNRNTYGFKGFTQKRQRK